MENLILSEKDAVVIKNSKWEVNQEIADSSDRFDLGARMQSLQLSDGGKNLHKLSVDEGELDDYVFGTAGKIRVVFIPNN